MNARTGLLLGAMVLMVGFFVGDQLGLLAFLDEGSSGHESQLDKIGRQISKAEDLIHAGVKADDKLEMFEKRSLPYGKTAKSEYQDWLTELVKQNQFLPNYSVEVSPPEPVAVKDGAGKQKEAFKKYKFSVNGIARLENVKQFMCDFYEGAHLHKITALNLTPGSGGRFNLSVSGEALGLTSCDRKSDLANEVKMSLARHGDEYDRIVRRNIFSREAGAALKGIRLSSITFDKQGKPEAWFKTANGASRERLQRGEKLEISVHIVEVIDVQPRTVLIDIDGQVVDMTIGQSVYDALQDSGELVAN